MNTRNLALVSTMVVLGAVATGCSSNNDDTSGEGNLASSESLLVADNDDVEEQDEDMEAGLEEPLSGAATTDPGTPAEGASDADLMDKVRTNPGRWYQPAGCITTTVAGNVATHVFKDCTGPAGLRTFNGTVVSTWTRGGGAITVVHEANDFKINGATISGKRTVVYTKSGSVVTRKRTGAWTGTTKNGKAFTHDASFTATWDPSTKCITRDGTASTSVANREFSRTVAGYKRCGVGTLGCPEAGTITLSRTKGDNTASVTVEFLGGREVRVTGSAGRSRVGRLICRAG
ncbi:MAG: hypothetical protein JST00_24080 [Deltaproteobacteria bacterium]|nr:hypothetical protein [Deltaproteobacteria bacterium]